MTNIYKVARNTAGYTQERWAEMLDVSVDTVWRWERGDSLPDDRVVCQMAEVSGLAALSYWHMKSASAIANDELPDVERLPLSEAVIRLLIQLKKINPQVDELLEIAYDGRVDDSEAEIFEQIKEDLNDVIGAALVVKYADTGRRGHD